MEYSSTVRSVMFFLLVLLLLGCQTPRSNDSDIDDSTKTAGTTGGIAVNQAPGAIDTKKQTEEIKKSLTNYPTQNETQKTAIQGLLNSVTGLGQAYLPLRTGLPLSQLSDIIRRIRASKEELKQAAQVAADAGLIALAETFQDMAKRQDVHRLYNPKTQDHFFTLSVPESHSASYSGYLYEGIAFRTYVEVRRNCNIELFRCYSAPATDHMISASRGCEGYSYEGTYGYICPNQTSNSVQSLARFYHPRMNRHFATQSEDEKAQIQPQGWNYEGTFGFPPN